MASKLADTQGATVHQLQPRKAKGAGGQKRKGPSINRSKPRAGESKPAARVAAQPSEADIRRDQQDRLVALHTKHRTVENREAVASEALSEIRGDKKLIRAAIQNAGFPLALYDEANKKLKLKTKKTDLEQQERLRGLIFEAFGLPVGPQPELALEGVPEAARPALHWEGVGYTACISGEFADGERDGVPPENLQDYMKGFSQGTARNAAGIKKLAADPPAAAEAAPPLMVGEDAAKAAVKYAEAAIAKGKQPAWNGFPTDPDAWTEGHAACFEGWFKSLDPADEVDVLHVGAAAMFDRLVEAEQSGTPGAEAPDDFEATPEELAAQAGRPGGASDHQGDDAAFSDD